MEPLHPDALSMRQPLQRARKLLEKKDWAAAEAVLDEFERSSPIEHDSPIYGEWCTLRSQVLVNAGEYRQAAQVARQGLAILQLTSQDDLLAEAHRSLGVVYLGLGETKRARVHARDALAIHRRQRDEAGMMRACNDLARIHFVRGEFDLALDHLNDAIELAERLGDSPKQTAFLGNRGRIFLLQGRWGEAEKALKEALDRARQTDSRVSMARNTLSLGYLAILQNDFSAAAASLDEALTLIEGAGLTRERAIHFEYSGWWHFGQRHWIRAKEAFRGALELSRHMSDESDLIAQSLRGLGECEAALGDWAEAQRLAEEGLAIALEIDERVEVGCLYRVLAVAQAHRDNTKDAVMSLARATDILEAAGDPYELGRLAMARAEMALHVESIGPDGAVAALRDAAALFEQLGVEQLSFDARWLLVEAHRAAGHADDAIAAARGLLAEHADRRDRLDQARAVLDTLAHECVEHSLSPQNEFRLGGVPWATGDGETPGDELQQAVEFYRRRINASRVLLLEVTAEGERSGRVIAQSGADDEFAQRVGAYVANAYQHDLATDTPRFYWSLAGVPNLAAHLSAGNGQGPLSVISVPVELGPAASGLLYADTAADRQTSSTPGFSTRDLDFAVAFAEVIAWRSTKLRSEHLLRDVHRLRSQLGRACEFPNIITQDTAFRETLARARMVADADVAVLLEGETGTGKDLLGRAIHYSSKRRDHRFVTVNCAALPETLLESELFGVKRGAFTGADRDKPGLFEEADGGTFFLDEIGEMPLAIQAKLLRLLESHELVRLGDTKPRTIHVRVISATNRDLTVEMEQGRFRRDLYYRLTPLVFWLPPLRERREDIPLLIDHFLEVVAGETDRRTRLSAETVRVMCAYQWPGNVRELENEIRKIVLLNEPDSTVGPDRLSQKFLTQDVAGHVQADQPLPERFSLYDHIAQLERVFIVRALDEAGGVKKHAAARLGIPESTLRLKMKQYDVAPD